MPEVAYSLRFPFTTVDTISGLENPLVISAGPPEVTLSQVSGVYVLSASPFPSEESAKAYWPVLWGALAWMSARSGADFATERDFTDVVMAADPEKAAENLARSFGSTPGGPVDGLADGNQPTVAPAGKSIRYLYAGEVKAVIGRPAANLQPHLAEALAAPTAGSLYSNDRLRIGVDLYSAAKREASGRSRLLTLVTALEVLSVPSPRHAAAQAILDALEVQVTNAISKEVEDSDGWHALMSLQREIWFKRESSLRSRVRELVQASLSHLSADERRRRAREAVWAYDQRGVLVHTGTLPEEDLGKAYTIANDLVRDILAASMGIR